MSKKDLTGFQLVLLENLVSEIEVLRNGHSAPVMDLIDKGYIKQEGGLYVATAKAKKIKF